MKGHLLTEAILHVLLRQRTIKHHIPFGVVRLVVLAGIIGIGRHSSTRKQVGDPLEQGKVEVPQLPGSGVGVWNKTISRPEDQLERGTEAEWQVVTECRRAVGAYAGGAIVWKLSESAIILEA